ncbi:MAG: hypothetical protein O3C21_08265 [Verrucomicrobia bacterium]|nr:hypothetical protein [Verrucomicrobiota bacterium]
MKLSSLFSRAILPFPLACALLLLFWLVAGGIRGQSNPEQRTLLNIVLATIALQIVVGVVTIHLLQRKPPWTYAFVGLGLGIVIAAFSGNISLFGPGVEAGPPSEAASKEFDIKENLGMLGLTIPAMVIAYTVSWWRFTFVPHKKRLRKHQRSQKGRLSREEIAEHTDLAGHPRHPKAALPDDRKPRAPKRRRH